MRRVFCHKRTRERCHIYKMLQTHAKKRHISFHTPGHKRGKWDITELSFSDNLACPHGCIADAERDIAAILGANKSFILTDGSTAGVLSILFAAKTLGVQKIAVCEKSHKSVFNGCALLGITPCVFAQREKDGIPLPLAADDEDFLRIADGAQAVLLTCPDYYGNIADLPAVKAYCERENKLLLIDGAHGGHLHFDEKLYAGTYAHLWVDGVHKSLPALTQGAVVSAKTEQTAAALAKAVDVFRSTSPSYPVMASVEYAVKYPQNEELEKKVRLFAAQNERLRIGEDWTKLCALFGQNANAAHKALEKKGIYAEFCDGNAIVFYLSPATKKAHFKRLEKALAAMFAKYPYIPVKQIPAPTLFPVNGETERVRLEDAAGRICAENCGMFPPCTPLLSAGERIGEEKIRLLLQADNVYGVYENTITVLKTAKKE